MEKSLCLVKSGKESNFSKTAQAKFVKEFIEEVKKREMIEKFLIENGIEI